MENQIYLLIRSLLGSLYLFAMTLPPYNLRVSEIWRGTLLQSSGWVWWKPWTYFLFCGCIYCCRHLWCLWFQQSSIPKGSVNDVDAEALLVSRTAAEGCTGTSVSKFANKTWGLCVITSLQLLTQLLIWLSLWWCNQCFRWLSRLFEVDKRTQAATVLVQFCGLWAVWRSVVVEHPVVIGWGIYHLAKQCLHF